MAYTFTSVFATEFEAYINFRLNAGWRASHIRSILKSLDHFLVEQDIQNLCAETISAWINSKCIKAATKINMIGTVKGFLTYLRSQEFPAIACPDLPQHSSEYTPYLFTQDEFFKIIAAADNFKYRRLNTRASVQAPILIRLLYGCGLRLWEALLLYWKDIDLQEGIITVLNAKNKKPRKVPMSASMTKMLTLYKNYSCPNWSISGLVFENRHGKPYSNCAAYKWFKKILNESEIHYFRTSKHERGPCLHCLRHQFALDSFLKSESQGRPFEETVPFLSAYLGHSSLLGTDKYLRANYAVYTKAHKKINDYIGGVFPEVFVK